MDNLNLKKLIKINKSECVFCIIVGVLGIGSVFYGIWAEEYLLTIVSLIVVVLAGYDFYGVTIVDTLIDNLEKLEQIANIDFSLTQEYKEKCDSREKLCSAYKHALTTVSECLNELLKKPHVSRIGVRAICANIEKIVAENDNNKHNNTVKNGKDKTSDAEIA